MNQHNYQYQVNQNLSAQGLNLFKVNCEYFTHKLNPRKNMDFIERCIEKGFMEKKNKQKIVEEYLIQLQNMKQKPQIEELYEKKVSNRDFYF